MKKIFIDRQEELWQAIIEHMTLSFTALFIAILIALPLSIYLTRHERLAEPIINTTAVMQTIPSLALLGLMIPLFGIGRVPAIIALVVYALLPIMRNTYTGIKEVDPILVEAAKGLGMTRTERLLKVELPLAMPVIMAGIRTAMVLIIGTATLAALIGAGGLGDLILLGIDRNNPQLIILGAIPAALLALIFDFVLRKVEQLPYRQAFVAFIGLLVVALLLIVLPMLTTSNEKQIVIGGKLGAEPEILMNMYKELIEQETDMHVVLEPGLGKTSFVYEALKNGDIDIYPEFTGTIIHEFLKEEVKQNEASAVYEQARDGILAKDDLVYFPPMRYNNTYALAVSEAFAKQYQLATISDLARISPKAVAGFTLEFSDREDGYVGLQSLYDLQFQEVVTMEPKLRYTAMENGEIDVLDAYSTDSELETYGLVVLEDDRHLFPPYQGAPLMRKETLEQYPELEPILNQLQGRVTDSEMRRMNYLVNVEDVAPHEVARQFLRSKGLLKEDTHEE